MNIYDTNELVRIFVANDSISSDGYMRFCDSQPNVHYHKRDFLYRGGLWRGEVVKSYLFHRQPEVNAVVLSHSDITTTAHDIRALKLMGNKWVFATNCTSVQDESWCLPIGLTNDCDDSPIHRILGNTTHLLNALRSIPVRPAFNNSILLSFNPKTAPKYRGDVFSLLNNQAGITTFLTPVTRDFQLNYTDSDRMMYCRLIRQHDFVLCPRGNGRDTHRLWECLYMGSIPIVKKGDLPQSLLREFPIWMVRDWREVLDPAQRIRAWKQLHERHWESQRLRQTYWNNFIAERCAGQTI